MLSETFIYITIFHSIKQKIAHKAYWNKLEIVPTIFLYFYNV